MNKRILSLTLALVMVLGAFTSVFAADTEKTEEVKVSAEVEAGEFLESVGVLKGDDNGDLRLEENLERRDSVILLSRLLGEEETAVAFTTTDKSPSWSDVRTDKYYVPFYAWAEENEYFEGNEDGTFAPRTDIKAAEYSLVLLRALGYDVKGHEEWTKAMETAEKAGLLKGVTLKSDDVVSRGEMSIMTVNALKAKMKDSDKTLAEELEIKFPEADVLKVNSVKAENLKEVEVELSKSATEESATEVENYSINNVTFDSARVDGNNVILTVKNKLVMNKEYELTVKGVKDEETTLDSKHKFTAIDNAAPEVVKVEGLGTKAVKVTVSEPVRNVKQANFKLNDSNLYADISVTGREIFIKPYTTMEVGEHQLTVGSLEDFNGFKSTAAKYPFEVEEDNEAPTVEEVTGKNNKVVVTFSEDVDSSTIGKKTVYWKSGSTKNYADAADVKALAGNKYEFTFSKANSLRPGVETLVFIEGVKDYSGNTMKDAEVAVRPDMDTERPVVTEIKATANDTIQVTFSKDVDMSDAKTSAIYKDNYKIVNKANKDDVAFITGVTSKGSKAVEIKLANDLKADSTHTVTVSGINDLATYPNMMLEHSEELAVKDYVTPEVLGASFADVTTANDTEDKVFATKVSVYFSKAMNRADLGNPKSYLVKLDGGSTQPLEGLSYEVSNMARDGKSIELTIRADKKIIEIAGIGIKDLAGNIINNSGTFFAHSQATVALSSENAIHVTKENEVQVEFNMDLKSIDTKAFTVDGLTNKSVTFSGKTVTITTEKMGTKPTGNVKIAKDAVEGYNGSKFAAEKTVALSDGIAPKLDEVQATVSENDQKLVLKLVFSEKIDETKVDAALANMTGLKLTQVVGNKTLKNEGTAEIEAGKDNVVVLTLNLTEANKFEGNYFKVDLTNVNTIADVDGNIAKGVVTSK